MSLPDEKDFDVEVEQGKIKRTLPIKGPTKDSAINQANRILNRQKVKPARVISATETTPAQRKKKP